MIQLWAVLSEAITFIRIFGEIVSCEQGPGNEKDRFAVASRSPAKLPAVEIFGYFYLENLACSLNFGANNNQFPQGCRITGASKFSGIYGS